MDAIHNADGRDAWENVTEFQDVLAPLWEQVPGLNPVLDAAYQTTVNMAIEGKSGYDHFMNREVLTQKEQAARTTYEGELRAWNKHMQWAWNKTGAGQLYEFKTDDPLAIESEFERFFGLPGIKPTLGRFIRVSDRGIEEQYRSASVGAAGEVALTQLKVDDVLQKLLSREPVSQSEKELVIENGKYAVGRLKRVAKAHIPDQTLKNYFTAPTKKDKAAVLGKAIQLIEDGYLERPQLELE